MKVIDLLNKIANGEELHFYVINNGFKTEYFYEKGKPLRYDDDEDVEWRISEDWLNCEVEIIEEDKKIEKLEHWVDVKSWVEGNDLEKGLEEQSEFNKNIYYKINEIIDKLNEIERDKE